MSFENIAAEELKRRLTERGVSGIALDIDDTLCHTDNHWIDEMSLRFGNPENLTREQILERYGMFEHVPYWNTEEALPMIDMFMHSNEFQETIPLIEEADRVVREINETVPVVAYITARPISVYEGTKRWLERHGFPDAPVIFRPLEIDHMKKNMWKADLLQQLYPQVAGIIDDHPGLAEQLESVGYQGRLYLYDNGSNEKDYSNTVSCKSWGELAALIAEHHARP